MRGSRPAAAAGAKQNPAVFCPASGGTSAALLRGSQQAGCLKEAPLKPGAFLGIRPGALAEWDGALRVDFEREREKEVLSRPASLGAGAPNSVCSETTFFKKNSSLRLLFQSFIAAANQFLQPTSKKFQLRKWNLDKQIADPFFWEKSRI